jgi:hypothetical protein
MHRHIGIAALFGAAFVSACTKEAPKPDSAAVAQAGARVVPKAGYDPATRTVTVIARDFAYEAPDSLPGGWTTIRMVNEGPTIHHMQLVRIDSGKTMADVQAAMKNTNAPPPKWVVDVGGPNAPNPGAESNTTMNLTPGLYVMLCFVDIPDKVAHMTKGMFKPLVVTAATAPGAAPTADVELSLTDYAFTAKSGALTAGKHTFHVVNDGPQVHEIEIFQLLPGKTMKDFAAWGEKYAGPPPVSALGGVVGLVKGADAYFTADFTPGNYVMICFVGDKKDNKPHFMHGMVKEFAVQ